MSAIQGDGANERRGYIALGLLMLFSCMGAYFPGLSGPLFFDDLPNITQNAYLAVQPEKFDSWRAAAISNESGILRRPLASLSFALNHALAGEWSSLQLKATNLAIHLLTGGLLFCWFLLLLRAPGLHSPTIDERRTRNVALFAAALWLLHPLHVSTVLYAVQRMAQLSTLFVVLGLWLFTRYRLRWATRGGTGGEIAGVFLWLSLITLAATLSKENGALLPWLVLVIEVFLFRGYWAGTQNQLLKILGWLGLAFPVIVVLVVFAFDPGLLDARYARREFTLQERLLTQSRLLWHYLQWTVLPTLSSLGFHHDDIPHSTGLLQPLSTIFALLAWTIGIALALLFRLRAPLAACALFFFLVSHSMESSFWPLEMAYEHRNYLPSAAVCLLLAAGLCAAAERVVWLDLRVAIAVPLLYFLITLALRAGFWGDEISLARHNVINHPQSPRAHFFYGNSLFKAFERSEELGLTEEERRAYIVTARQEFVAMYQLSPDEFAALVMLYQLDNNFFRALPDRPDWLARMEEVADTRRLQASDLTAIEALANYAVDTPERDDDAAVAALLDRLLQRNRGRMTLWTARYKLAAASDAVSREESLELLQVAARRRPGDLRLYPRFIGHHGRQDLGAVYDTVLVWLQNDTLRRDLTYMRRMFE